MNNRLQEKWQHFRVLAIPASAPQQQLFDMRAAFFAGAQAALNLVETATEEMSEDQAVQLLADLHKEMQQFAQQLKLRGRTEKPR